MPELPEVETVRRVIEPQISGLTIKTVTAVRPEVIAYPAAEDFCRRLAGQIVARIERRGKYMIVRLQSGDRMLFHLRMTGCLLLTPADEPREKHTHLILRMGNGTELRFSDQRRFGRFWLFGENEADCRSGVEKLGLEPSDPDLSSAYLRSRLEKRKRAIKSCLLEQNVIAGIGNIYSDEILFAARIHPARSADSLSGEEWERLAAAIPERISYFIEKNAISPEDYRKGRGRDYRNTPFLQVYGRRGKACPVCGEMLCRAVVGGRGSIYCPFCQN